MRDLINTNSVFYLRKDVYDDYKEYKDDFKQVIMEREKTRLMFCHQSPQIFYRPSLVHYLRKICTAKCLSHSCLHLSVYLLDIFMDNHHIVPDRLLLAANVCLRLSAKLEENTLKIPKISELNALTNDRYTLKDHTNLEILIVHFFRFTIKIPCAVHYVFYYMQEFISVSDLNPKRTFRSLFFELRSSICRYLDRVIDDVHYMQYYQPSQLAAAVIAVSRLDVGLEMWTKQLESLTDYKPEQLVDLVQILTKNGIIRCIKCTLTN